MQLNKQFLQEFQATWKANYIIMAKNVIKVKA